MGASGFGAVLESVGGDCEEPVEGGDSVGAEEPVDGEEPVESEDSVGGDDSVEESDGPAEGPASVAGVEFSGAAGSFKLA